MLVFVTPFYGRLVAPDSTTGSFERSLGTASAAATDPASDVLVLGDSRIARGFDVATADRTAHALHFIDGAVAGTTPRCWTVYARALDPAAARFRAIVIPVDTYADDDGAIGSADGDDRFDDLHYVVDAATTGEIVRIAASFPRLDRRLEALFDLGLRGPLMRDDLQDFVRDPRARFAALAAARDEIGTPAARGSMTGLRVDFARNTLIEPALFAADHLAALREQVLGIAHPDPAYGAYRREWLGAIVRRYRAAGVRVVVVRIPTRPVRRPGHLAPPSGSLADFARDDGAVLLPQAPYVALERPQWFADEDHLNRDGAERFSALLARDVAAAVARPPAPSHAAARAPLHDPVLAGFGAYAKDLGIGEPLRFQSFAFALFFCTLVVLYQALRRPSLRRGLLLIASWYFYARWNASYLVMLLALTLTDFGFGIGIERTTGIARRAMLSAGVTANVAFLGTIKYADFFSGSVAAVRGLDGDPWALHFLVPVGLSFHTFQSISYLVDVARGKVRAERNVANYALYIAFFPQLLAGPIVRAQTFFGELYAERPVVARFSRGLGRILIGLVKKGAIADRLAPGVDAYFAGVAAHPGAPAAWAAAFAFALQIYFDFSGYTDIAIGCALVLGFEFPENFRRPYLSWSITEFWRRWHMTLSAWLRDYLYVPLGGNRFGRLATTRNLMLTMLLGGLWHGANWTFVVWGGYHGAALALERAAGIGRSRNAPPPHGVARIARVLATFAIVTLGWVVFRAQSPADAGVVLTAMLAGGPGPAALDGAATAIALGVFAIEIARERGLRRPLRPLVALRGAAIAGLLVALELGTYPGPASQFVYFKF